MKQPSDELVEVANAIAKRCMHNRIIAMGCPTCRVDFNVRAFEALYDDAKRRIHERRTWLREMG